MGASGWSYFVPYQPDLNAALRQIQETVFRSGDYFRPARFYRQMLERGAISKDRFYELVQRAGDDTRPATMQELIELRGKQGTHSILDMRYVSPDRDLCTISALMPHEYRRLWRTLHPTHEMAAAKIDELTSLRGAWQGVYAIIWRGEKEHEILFCGMSGD